jgi:hypothetical protein
MQKIIFDRLCEFGLPFDVCSSPKATYLLRGNEMMRIGCTGRAPALPAVNGGRVQPSRSASGPRAETSHLSSKTADATFGQCGCRITSLAVKQV